MLLHVCTVSKNPNLYPLTYDFAKMHSAKAAVAVCSPQRTPTSGRFLMDSPSRGSVSWAFAKFGYGYYVWIDLALNLLQSGFNPKLEKFYSEWVFLHQLGLEFCRTGNIRIEFINFVLPWRQGTDPYLAIDYTCSRHVLHLQCVDGWFC